MWSKYQCIVVCHDRVDITGVIQKASSASASPGLCIPSRMMFRRPDGRKVGGVNGSLCLFMTEPDADVDSKCTSS
ncbi:hypothetical protein BYT27DRAFT_7180392 [Phlegmacium glaucopus]|nr:hypothetical protein BYT27DRAFT_7180392 [Phlegmacium glaucopus]